MAAESFMKSLFGGVVSETLLFPFPETNRTEADELLPILESFRKLASKQIDSARLDEQEAIGADLLESLKDLGLFGLVVPKAFGGAGLSATAYARAIQEFATADASVAMTLSAHESLGVAALMQFGSPGNQARWLPRLAKGELIAAFALAEVGAGSDAAAIQTRADVEGDTYVLSGEKAWVTNGGLADLFIVFARTSPADEGAKPRLTAFVVERGPGVTSSPSDGKLGVRATSTTSVRFDQVRVSKDQVLGEVGRGFKVAMEIFSQARIALAASCMGQGKRILRVSVERVHERKAFGRNLEEFGIIRDKIAQMTSDLFALESMVYLTTGFVDAGSRDFTIESAICKVFASETLWRIANEAAQIAGARSYMRGHIWERLLRDARIPMVYEGTNEILRCFIALVGMQDRGGEIEEVSKAMREPIKGFGLLSDLALRKARSALGRDRLTKAHPALSRETSILEEYTGHLSRAVDTVLRRHGNNIAEMQFTQKRIADIAIDLFAIAAIVSRTTSAIDRRGEEGSRREIGLANVFVTTARLRMEDNISAMDDNDDELRKAIAQRTCTDGGYPLDVL
jgi:acyl-CoA dehydrogenase family protein 9